ncbi:Uncharacterised protein [Enterobacter cloacae]|nr:Uncharacterised protein [Enterobacter cloacae]
MTGMRDGNRAGGDDSPRDLRFIQVLKQFTRTGQRGDAFGIGSFNLLKIAELRLNLFLRTSRKEVPQ